MIIDFHTHIRENRGEVKDFLKAMDANGIDKAVVHPIIPDHGLGRSDNEFVGSLVKKYHDRLIGFACVVPYEDGAVDELYRAVETYGFKGLKLHPPIQGFNIADSCMDRITEACIDLDIPILFHTGPIYSRTARMANSSSLAIDDLAIKYPDAKLVIGHGDPFGIDPVLVAKHPNVYMDTTIVFSYYVSLFPQIGPAVFERMRTPDRILFGTDANPLQGPRFAYNLDPLKAMDVPADIKAKLLGGNAARLLKLA
jgi:predicted TIM-barrel fold metal-dependent hydrolase